MKELIERLEKAAGPSRELDGAVWCAANGYEFLMWDGAGCCYMAKRRGWISADHIKNFTASLDAALTLVGENDWDVGRLIENAHSNGHVMVQEIKDGELLWHSYNGRHVVPAIALCIAALRGVGAPP